MNMLDEEIILVSRPNASLMQKLKRGLRSGNGGSGCT